jgi:hypothetical protein
VGQARQASIFARVAGAALVAATAAAPLAEALAQDTMQSPPGSVRATTRKGITGTWERYSRGGGLNQNPTGPQPPANVVVPARIPTPPFKPDQKVAYEAAAKAAREADLRGEPIAINSVNCVPEGMIAMMNAIFPMEILETPGQITIIQESYNQVRRIYLDEVQGKVGEVEPGFFGHSVGKWEGDTLVVDTIGVKEAARFRQGAEPQVPHSLEMRISERFKLLTPDFLQNEVTITDPVYLAEPWKFTYLYRRVPGYKIQEYVCEDNRAYVDAEGHTRVNLTGARPAK